VAGGGGNTARPTIGAIDVPPSDYGATYPQPGKPPKGKPPVIAAAPPSTKYVPRPISAPPEPAAEPMPVAGGWRVQLGAFGDPSNADKLWSEVGGRFPGRQASFVKAGALTKLLVGPYRSKSEAASACGAVKPCMPVAP
jgi:cell division septation protein DedD